jgi:hypothetical protein
VYGLDLVLEQKPIVFQRDLYIQRLKDISEQQFYVPAYGRIPGLHLSKLDTVANITCAVAGSIRLGDNLSLNYSNMPTKMNICFHVMPND